MKKFFLHFVNNLSPAVSHTPLFHFRNKGFTLVEIIIVTSIIVVIGTFSALYYSRFLGQNNVIATQDQLISVLRKAHIYATTSRKSATSGWGVHFDSGTKKVILFQGASYATRNAGLDESFILANSVTMTGFTDVIYQRVTGYPTFVGAVVPTTIPTPTALPPGNWYNASWGYRKQITIDGTQVAGSSNFTNFPVLISITDASLAAHSQSSGNDILFTDSTGLIKLDHEIERYTSATGTLVAWVRLPTLNATTNTDIFLYYGNPGAANQQNVAGTWDANYNAVWHLKETSGQHLDSTSNNNDSTSVSAGTQGSAAGKIDGADDFTVNTQKVQIPDSASLEPGTSNFTLHAWVKFDSLTSTLGRDQKVVYKTHPSASPWVGYELLMDYPSNNLVFQWTNGTSYYSGGYLSPAIGTWYSLVGVKNGTTTTLYVNGILATGWNSTSTTGGVFDTNSYLAIGNASGTENVDGIVDEVRLETTARSADWISTEYNNQNSPSTFYAISTETAYAALPTTAPTSPPAPTPPPSGTVTITISGSNGMSRQVFINGLGIVSK